MPNELKIEVSGHLVRDAELRYASSTNKPFITATVARNKGGKDDANKKTTYINLVIFGKAEEVESGYSKGLDKGKAIRFIGDDLEAKGFTKRDGSIGAEIKVIGWINNLSIYRYDEANQVYVPEPVVKSNGKKASPKQQDMFSGKQQDDNEDPPF